MAKHEGPGDARGWVGEEARRILAEGDRLLAALTAFHQKAKQITTEVDAAAKAVATQLTSPPSTPNSVTSPLLNQIAVTVEAGGRPTAAVTLALAARLQEHRASELFRSATTVQATASNLVAAARPTGSRVRFAFKGKDGKTQGIEALQSLERLLSQVEAQGLQQSLATFASSTHLSLAAVTAEHEKFALQRIGRALGLRPSAGDHPAVAGPDLVAVRTLAREGRVALAQRPALIAAVTKSFTAVQNRMVDRQLQEIPVERLKDAAGGRIRFKTLGDARIATVYDALHPRAPLASIHGISETMDHQVTAAAFQVAQAVRDDLRFRIDLDKTDSLVTGLLTDLNTLLRFDSFFNGNAEQLQQATDYLAPILSVPSSSTAIALFAEGEAATSGLAQVQAWAEWARKDDVLDALARAAQPTAGRATPGDVWADFERRSAAYYALLGQLVDLRLDIEAAEGFLPQDIVERVHEQSLDDTFLRASLRGYQSFGARYALVQRRVILGDEMGLGKTVQAIAVMAHLQATGHTHYLVVCPASVLINWTREVRMHSTLRPFHVHGSDRDRTWRTWQKYGGVAVTTFDTLRTLADPDVAIALLTVDEAHYIKNPDTIRAHFVSSYADVAERTLFMTGTPMENRVEEFRQLIQYLQPDVSRRVSATDGIAGARRFREAVAPVYLRRNTEDVLQELPPMVQVDEWEQFDRDEWLAYRDAVAAGNFMAMRRVAFLADPAGSTKIQRLLELCDEAGANGHKVIVFSYFREVLDVVVRALGRRAVGPLTGSVSAAGRQQLVDTFDEAPGSAVLVSQIQAGGVGLNMQAGSVVVLCEPQVKPSLEAQAIARAHRMGQVRTVQVHRLLIADSVDQRMIEILDSKQQLFDEYARGSDIADASPEAVDVSERSLAREVVAQEQERLAVRLAEELGTAASGE